MNDRAKAARGVRSAATVTTLLQSVCDRLPVGFALFDADLELAAWNARFVALSGYPRKLIKAGTPFESFVRFDAKRGESGRGAIDALTRSRLALLKRGRRTDREQALPDGRLLHVVCERLPESGLLLTCEDVTETRHNEERLREGAARYELALRAISEGFYDWDIASGTVHYSERVRHAVGLSPVQLKTPGDWFARIHPDDQPRYRAASAAHFKGETERFECEYRYRARDGTWRWARQHGVALRDARGRAYRMVGSTGDITDLKRVEEALRESEERYALAMRAAVEGIYEWNVETGTLFLSDQARAFFAFPVESLAPKDWNARVHPEDLEAYQRATVNHFKGRTPHLELEYRIRDAAGGYRWVLDRGIAVRSAKGRVTRLVGALSDITQRKLAETQLRRARDEATAALGEQTALREVLEAISRSAFDLDAVLRTLIEHATQLAGAEKGFIFRLEGDVYRLAVDFGAPPEFREFIERNPIRADSGGVVGLTARAGRTVHIEDATTDPRFRWQESQRLGGFRTVIGVPMLREGAVIGVIALWKERVEPFTQAQIDLVTAFSNQALIAIENARLFSETKEALEHQTATAEILRVISSSPTDLQPVFEAIVESATRLCESADASLYRAEGDVMRHVASHGVASTLGIGETRPITRGSVSGRSMIDRRPVHVPDLVATSAEYPEISPVVFQRGVRATLGVPLLREGIALGSIVIRRLEVRPFSDRQIALLKTFADQAVIAIENVRLFQELQAKNRELTEALEQQTATGEILRVISSSPTDLAPVFDAVAKSAARLCDAPDVVIIRAEGDFMRFAASVGPFGQTFGPELTIPINRGSVAGRAVLERRTIQVQDLAAAPEDEYPVGKGLERRYGHRTMVAAPLLLGDTTLGAIAMLRTEVRPFSDKQLALLRTFADQAVIAIQNARLFNETKEALERQTATAEILKVISSSPTDVQPVFEAIIASASRLAGGCSVNVSRVVGDELHLAAYTPVGPAKDEILRNAFPVHLSEARPIAEAVRRRSPFVVSDHETDPLASAKSRDVMRARGFRSTLYVPIVHGEVVLGVMHVSKVEPGPFPQQSVELLTTFADQAAIAIENVRLFNETKEALDQQRASAEVLSAISSSIADARPVFDKILERCQGLFGGRLVGINLVGDDGLLGLAAYHGPGREELERVFPLRVDRDSGSGRSIVDRCVIHYPDAQHGADVPDATRRGCTATGIKSVIFAPMLWEGRGIGVIFLGREHLGSFSEKEIALLKTFADQAVIAIQNARLFNETKEALEQQTATAEILKVISSSPTDIRPVLDAVAQNAARLCGAPDAFIAMADGEVLRVATSVGPFGKTYGDLAIPITRGSVSGRAVLDRTTIHVVDLAAESEDEYPVGKKFQRVYGHRTVVAPPLLRGDSALGVINVLRQEVRPFTDRQIALLKTFADQAVIAIENVRLFNETKEALERQTATADILQVISSSLTDLAPVFDAILENAIRLCDGDTAALWRYDGHVLRFAAGKEISPEAEALLRRDPLELGGYNPTPQAALERRTVHVLDVFGAPDYRPLIPAGTLPHRPTAPTVLAVPLLREGELLGVISVWRLEKRLFTDKQVEMVNTFAAQAVIAIENVRLFNETKEALDQQKASAEVLQVISSSVADTQPVFDKILESCERLFVGQHVGINLIGEDGAVHLGPYRGPRRPELERVFPLPLSRESATGSAILERRVMHYPDMEHATDVPEPVRRTAKMTGFKSVIFAPMLWEGRGIGAIWVNREFAGPFSDKEIGLLKTFADQAVIAIQNAKLFHEIQEKSHQLEIADQHKSAFLANMSHELRTPLNAVIGFSEMLTARYFGELTAKQAEYVNDIHGSGKHLLSLINDILDLSKIEAGRTELELAEFDLPAALDNALTLVRERAQRGGVALRMEADPVLRTYRGDERKLKQVVLNLLSNAVKFTPSGGSVSVVAKQVDGNAEIAVSDTGVGIAPADHEAIFEAFRQVGTDVTRKREGTGLGLALARRFVELHGGTIRVESTPGKGSTFTVRLPIRHGE